MVASAHFVIELYEPETLRARPANVGSGCCLLHVVRVVPASGAGDDVRDLVAVDTRGAPRQRAHRGGLPVAARLRPRPPRLLAPTPQPHHRRRSLARGARASTGHAIVSALRA